MPLCAIFSSSQDYFMACAFLGIILLLFQGFVLVTVCIYAHIWHAYGIISHRNYAII